MCCRMGTPRPYRFLTVAAQRPESKRASRIETRPLSRDREGAVCPRGAHDPPCVTHHTYWPAGDFCAGAATGAGAGGRTLLSVSTVSVFPVALSMTSMVGTSVQYPTSGPCPRGGVEINAYSSTRPLNASVRNSSAAL